MSINERAIPRKESSRDLTFTGRVALGDQVNGVTNSLMTGRAAAASLEKFCHASGELLHDFGMHGIEVVRLARMWARRL